MNFLSAIRGSAVRRLKGVLFSVFVLIFLNGWAVVAQPVKPRPVTLDDVMALRNVSQAAISPDGRWVVFVVTEADLKANRFNTDLWLASTGPDRRVIQLTRNPKRDDRPQWSPDGRWIAFLSERGKEKPQIWRISPTGGEAERLTDVKTGVSQFRWSPDGRQIAYTAREPEPEALKKRKEKWGDFMIVDEDILRDRLYVIDVETKKVRELTPNFPMHVDAMDWSPDGKMIVFSARPTPKVPDRFKSDLYLVPADGSAPPLPLVKRPGPDSDPRWSPDGRWIAFVTRNGREDWVGNTYLARVSPDGKTIQLLTESFDEVIRGDAQWSPDERAIYFEAGHRMTIQAYAVDVKTAVVRPITQVAGVITSFHVARDGRTAAFIRQDPRHPPDVYTGQLRRRGHRWALDGVRRLTDLNPQVRDLALGTVEPFTWKAPDGLQLEGLVVRPPDFQPDRRYPLLVVIHGGPAGVFLQSFTLRRGAYPIQVFASQGYMVFMPNPRGSGNYGEKFRKMNYRDWGYGDYRDIMSGVDALIDRGWVDPDRVGVMGWSYGGYMTSWVVTQTNRFKAASVGAGVTDLFSMFGTTDIPPFMLAHFGRPPWEDAESYFKHSAMAHVAAVKTPTLIQHGDRDRRVPTFQSWEFYTALKMRGVPVRFILYKGQPHGIRVPKLVKAVMKHNLDWFHRWLPPSDRGQGAP